ncbi:1-acyl-sn-glycerol-3-phosphate acyltransferase [uncultured Sunxiuqinia sp.]|uniref:1-acyl-sn-glycerol-3-phosphate acyltransferase n=1 Tax=uncultured Sunxiuqinia sp. TaxID=1573825 RepID=UPI002AA7CABD|nr:1-acyl-sn-glycerol-3-phosphate acyltransferase [uncultured Sunxiuqinia sp.]
MKKWSLGYEIVRQLVRLAFWLSHKKITVIGKKQIPSNQPIIFTPNHQNALMDPLAVICTSSTQPVWLARADLFKLKSVRPILHFFKILPVYRIRDGKSKLAENETIFNKAIELLEHKKQLALFPEAAHSGKRQMLPHRKAVPRIAFLAEEKNNFKLNLQIIPVGIYYSHYWKFNREVLVNYGNPITIGHYQEKYLKSPNQSLLDLKDEIEQKVEDLTINVRSKKHYENYELILKLRESSCVWIQERLSHKENFFKRRELLLKIEERERINPDVFKIFHDKLDQIRKVTDKQGINIEAIDHRQLKTEVLFFKTLLALVLSPLVVLGFILHGLPFLLPRYFIQRKVIDPTFYSTFQFVSGLVIYTSLVIIIGVLLFILTGQWFWPFVFLPAFLFTGKLSFMAFQYWEKHWQQLNFYQFSKKHPKIVENLIVEIEFIKSELDRIIRG